ncbi:MAG: hypothetical protein QGG04_09225 [Candidatus Marinimicrobia bacterium]|jgi:hypothetical protein|nr:hypothetical protein [Chloroflexota bacterium]MDP6821634.1 hypothetical protein [Candidatus Neomarinimicrobiota bacterium]|tara:strand:+ start:1554 stop:1856 length:303 start_codon:yes stop_codon:yes gene_type:complete
MGVVNDKLQKIETKIELLQDEYFELLINVVSNNQSIITKNKGYTYWNERLKELQRQINLYCNYGREVGLEKARDALEEAFTPRIRSMLNEKVVKEIEDVE